MARQGTFYDKDRDRWYTHPNNPTSAYAGVTSVLNARNKVPINKSKVKAVATYAAKNRKTLADMTQAGALALLTSEDETLPDWRVGRDFGSAAHQVLENILTGRPLDEGVSEVEGTTTYPVVNNFTEWVPRVWDDLNRDHDIEVIDVESTVMSHTHGYGGSFDLVLKLDGKLTIVDAKSNLKGPHADVGLQNKAYAKADVIVDMDTGRETEMHHVEQAAVLWLRPEGHALYPLRFDEDMWRYFYACLLMFKFTKAEEGTVIGERLSGDIDFTRWNH